MIYLLAKDVKNDKCATYCTEDRAIEYANLSMLREAKKLGIKIIGYTDSEVIKIPLRLHSGLINPVGYFLRLDSVTELNFSDTVIHNYKYSIHIYDKSPKIIDRVKDLMVTLGISDLEDKLLTKENLTNKSDIFSTITIPFMSKQWLNSISPLSMGRLFVYRNLLYNTVSTDPFKKDKILASKSQTILQDDFRAGSPVFFESLNGLGFKNIGELLLSIV